MDWRPVRTALRALAARAEREEEFLGATKRVAAIKLTPMAGNHAAALRDWLAAYRALTPEGSDGG